MRTVLVTGAGGFIARAAARRLAAGGCRVIGVSHSGAAGPEYARTVRAGLGDSLNGLLEGERLDAVIHAAVHAGEDEYRVNVEGTRRWLAETSERGAPLQVFLSTLSARPDALSAYGRSKYALEDPFVAAGGAVLRLGVVVGNGGMFGKMVESLRRAPVVPLLDGGRGRIHVLGIDFLALLLARIVTEDGGGFRGRVLHVQQPEPHSLSEVLEAIRRHYGFSCRFVSVPLGPVELAVGILERIPGVRLPVSGTNLRGLRQSRNETFPSDFPELGFPVESLDQLVARAAARARDGG